MVSLPASLRALKRSPVFAFAVAATLSVGIGALTLTFGVLNAALYREPPFEDAERLSVLYIVRNPEGQPQRRERWSFARARQLREMQKSFELVADYSATSVTLSGDGLDAELVRGELASAPYFPLMRVMPRVGRLYTDADDVADAPTPVMLVSRALWNRRWPAEQSVIGKSLMVNGVRVEIIGVFDDFAGVTGRAELWLPSTIAPLVTYADYTRTNQNFISVLGRLHRGVSLEDANAELGVVGATINRAMPSDPRQPDERVWATAVSLNQARVDPTLKRSLPVLFGAVALLHLLACANVVNLLLGRAAARRHESAVRSALGSGPRRLFLHLLGEGAFLASVGAVAGIMLAKVGSAWIVPPTNVWAARNFYGSVAPFDAPSFGGVEFAFGVLAAVVTTAIVAVPPALSAFGINLTASLKSAARGPSGGAFSLRRPSAPGVIVGIETALAVLLVAAAGLLIDSYRRMRQEELGLGVDPAKVLTFWVIPSEARIPPSKGPQFVSRLLEAVIAVPGVEAATVDGGGPLSGTASAGLFIAGRPAPPPGQAPSVLRHYVAPQHFETLGIPLVRGRAFNERDVAGAPRVVIISEGAAKKFWPDQNPIGQRVWFTGGSTFNSPDSSAEIIGIVGDVVYAPLDQNPNVASFYTPFAQFTYPSRMVFVRTAGNASSLINAVRKALTTVEPDLAMRDARLLSDVVSGSWARNRFDAMLFGGFGIAALVLAASGVFAVLAYAVANRTREFGIRQALGASSPNVVLLVMREGLLFPAVGAMLGILACVASTRVLKASLYNVSALDPGVLAGTVTLMGVAAVMACVVPALRAMRADPIEALRAD